MIMVFVLAPQIYAKIAVLLTLPILRLLILPFAKSHGYVFVMMNIQSMGNFVIN